MSWIFLSIIIATFLISLLLSFIEVVLSRFSNVFLIKFLREKGIKSFDAPKVEFHRRSLRSLKQFFIFLFFLFFWFYFGNRFKAFLVIIASLIIYLFIFEILPNLLALLLKEKGLFIYPLLRIFNLPFFKISPSPKEKKENEGEYLEIIIEQSEKEGLIKEDEGELLEGVIKFRDVIVRDVMTPRANMVCVSADTKLKELKEIVASSMHSRIPVYSGTIDNIIGIILAKDLLKLKEDELEKPASSLVRETFFIPETLKIHSLLQEFQKRRQKMAIIIDEFGGVSGVVTTEDLFEEIVGELKDEYEREDLQDIIPEGDGYIVKGETELETLMERIGCKIEDPGFKTVGGYITGNIRRIPEKGEEIQIGNLKFKIIDADQVKIEKIKVEKIGS
ncbi:MAG: hemolysin family protein [Candidatus Aminicenantia bacterium]